MKPLQRAERQPDFATLCRRSQADFAAKIPQHIGRLGWDAKKIAEHQRRELRRILAHAKENSPFYAERFRSIDPETFELEDLRSLPVLGKAEMMDRFDDVVTDRRLSRDLVEAHLSQTGNDPNFLLQQYLPIASGGSSGRRGVFVWHWQACSDYLLGIVRPTIARLMTARGSPPTGVSLALIAAGSAVHATRAHAAIFSGDMIRITAIPVTLPLTEIVAQLNELQPTLVSGYPTMLAVLAEQQAAGKLAIGPVSISGTGETFLPALKAKVSTAFKAPVGDQFASSEGLLGVAPPGCDAITLATDLAIVELVDEDDVPVPAGTPSAKVLVTCLFNYTQPLIRYELNDQFVEQPGSAERGYLEVMIEGRNEGVFYYGDIAVHPNVIRSVLVQTPEVIEYQARQTRTGIEVDVLGGAAPIPDALADRIRDALASVGLSGPEISVRPVSAIERHPATGKVRRFIPL